MKDFKKYLAHVSSSKRNRSGENSIASMIFAAMLVEPDAEFELKDLGSIFATLGRLSMKGEILTPAVHKETTEVLS
jgi:hypothetical protein